MANTLFPSVNIPSFLKQTVFLSTLILKQKWIWDFIFTTIFTDKLEQNKFGKGFKTKDLTRKLIKSKYMQTQFAKFCELILTKCTTLPLWLLWRLKLEMEKKRGLTQLNWFNYQKCEPVLFVEFFSIKIFWNLDKHLKHKCIEYIIFFKK